jgi:hypothetical protein
MTDYFIGVEDINFSPIAGPTLLTGSPFARTGWARVALCGRYRVGGGLLYSAWRVPYYWGVTVAGAWWFTFRSYAPVVDTVPGPLMRWLSTGDQPRLELWPVPASGDTYTNNIPSFYKIDAAGNRTLLTPFTGAFAWNGPMQKWDIYVNYSPSGSIAAWIDGDQLCAWSGDPTTDGVTTLTGFELTAQGFSEILWSTNDTRGILGVFTLVPTAAGNSDNWTQGSVADINETAVNDGTVNASNTAGQLQQYTTPALPVTQGTVQSVMLSARAIATAGGPQHLDLILRTNNVNTSSGLYAPAAGFANLPPTIWQTNPVTGLPWTLSDLNSPPFNIGIQSAA